MYPKQTWSSWKTAGARGQFLSSKAHAEGPALLLPSQSTKLHCVFKYFNISNIYYNLWNTQETVGQSMLTLSPIQVTPQKNSWVPLFWPFMRVKPQCGCRGPLAIVPWALHKYLIGDNVNHFMQKNPLTNIQKFWINTFTSPSAFFC